MDALAQRYIELWQDQMTQISADPAITEAWKSVFETAAKNVGLTSDVFAAYTAAFAGTGTSQPGAAPGSAPTAPASSDGGSDLADVLRRLDALERRIADLEADRAGG